MKKIRGGARPLRKNVLSLFGFGYASLLLVFLGLSTSSNVDAGDVADLIQGPLMALIGGSIAVAKDLLQIDIQDAEDARLAAQEPGREEDESQSPTRPRVA